MRGALFQLEHAPKQGRFGAGTISQGVDQANWVCPPSYRQKRRDPVLARIFFVEKAFRQLKTIFVGLILTIVS